MSFLRSTFAVLCVIGATLITFAAVTAVLSILPFGGKPMIQRIIPLQNPGGPSHSLVRFREAANRGPVDIVFLGSSHTYRGFDPRLFAQLGYSSQNLGSSSQTPLNTYCLLERYLDTLKPKLIIYEVYQTALSIDGMESYYDLLSNTPIDQPMVEMAWNIGKPQVWSALIATELRNLRKPLETVAQRGKEGRDDLYIEGGYVQTRAEMPADRLAALLAGGQTFSFPLDQRQFGYLGKCIALSRSRGVAFVGCSYPIPPETRRALVGYAEKQKSIADFLKKKGVAYRDFNADMTLDTARDYYDEVHLNQGGVQKFHKALVTWLQESKMLPEPHQGR